MNSETLQNFGMILTQPLTNLWNKMLSIIPNIIAAVVIIILGHFIAKMSSFILKKALEKFSIDKIAQKSGIADLLIKIDEELSLSALLSKILYIIIFIMFVMSAAEVLHLSVLAHVLQSALMYLPNIVGAIFILMFGLFIASSTKSILIKSASSMNIDFAELLGKLISVVISIITISLAINQLEIQTELLNQAVSITLLAIGVALALSLGLGTKDISTSIIAGNYLREIYNPADTLEIGDISGKIITIGTTKTIIETQEKKEISISNTHLLQSTTIKN